MRAVPPQVSRQRELISLVFRRLGLDEPSRRDFSAQFAPHQLTLSAPAVLAASGPPQDRIDAQRVLSLLSHGRHFVLVCLLLSNVIVNETLRALLLPTFLLLPRLMRVRAPAVFLDSLIGGGGLAAIVISSAAIVIFGEVLPQALCAQYGLRVGAKCVGFVQVLVSLPCQLPGVSRGLASSSTRLLSCGRRKTH